MPGFWLLRLDRANFRGKGSISEAAAPKQLWFFFVSQVARISGEGSATEAAVSLWAFLHGKDAFLPVTDE